MLIWRICHSNLDSGIVTMSVWLTVQSEIKLMKPILLLDFYLFFVLEENLLVICLLFKVLIEC